MSFIIEQLGNPPFSHSDPNYQSFPAQKKEAEPTPTYLLKQKENLVKSLGSLSNCVVSSVIEGQEMIVNILVNNIFRNVPIIFKIRLNGKTKQLKISFNLINNDNKFIILNSKQRRILFSKILASRYYLTSFQQFKMAVKIQTGQIQFFSPIFYLNNSTPQPISKIAHQIFKHFLSNMKNLNPSINFLKQICNETCSQFHHEFTRRPQNQKLNKIYYYSHFTNVSVNLTLDSTNQEASILLKQKKEIRSLEELKNNYLPVKFKNGLQLFSIILPEKTLEDQIKKYQIDYYEREKIGEKTALPPMPRAKIPENNYILNFIKLSKNYQKLLFKQLNSGGFADIYLTQVQYWYVGSYSTTVNHQSTSPPLKKYIVVKRAKKDSQLEDKRNRIAHERAIINKIKHGLSLFLPKYYINSEKDDDNQILSDFISYPTLSDYVSKNKQTMSYHTKIFFGYIIAQALRYLQEYNIVHLDLKPPNIMLYKNMMVKLIDFGESYHPDVNNSDYRPGFSIPYSAPENYHKSDFTYKNDVFSLGIILYELFLSKLPFFVHDKQNKQKMEQVYRNNESISKFWYCSPEENINFGESQVFPLIQLLIFKCISHQPKERPELQWIVFVLRNCLDYLFQP